MIDLTIPTDTMGLFNFTQYVKNKGTETFPYIFLDNIDFITDLYQMGKLRDVTYDNIQKTILCSSIYLGYDLFECPDCGKETIVAHTCKSRFCSKCGVKSSQKRAAYVSTMAFETKHRHIVFTIPQELRTFFIKDRSLLDGFFVAARNTLSCVFNDRKFRANKNKHKAKGKYYPKHTKHKSKYLYKDTTDTMVFGAIASLHTFGRPLEFNPHLHVLVCEKAYDTKNNTSKNFSFMSYEKLRQTWRYQILDYLDTYIGDKEEFQRLKLWFYTKYTEGFYVRALKPKKDQEQGDIDKCVQYITRYTSRPIMAESRIVKYDTLTKTVHWFYHRHEDEKRVDVTEPVESFIKKVIMHCPEENFKMVRYYGLYSNKGIKNYNKMADVLGKKQRRELLNKEQRCNIVKIKEKKTHFRYYMIQTFQRDPLLCSCGQLMTYLESYNPLEGGGKNDRRYRDKCILENKYLKRQKFKQQTST